MVGNYAGATKIIINYLSQIKPDYLFIAPAPQNKQKYMIPIIYKYSNYFNLVYNSNEAKIYKINLPKQVDFLQ